MKTHYLYRHIREDKNIPFYIGIGTINNMDENYNVSIRVRYRRAFAFHKHNIIWDRIINKTKFCVEILFESNDFQYIKDKEKEFISLYKRIKDGGTLANVSLGGGGAYGIIASVETRKKQSDAKLGDKNPNRIHPYTDERKRLLSLKLKGKKRTAKQKIEISKSNWIQRCIYCVNNGIVYRSATEAARQLLPMLKSKIGGSGISRATNNGIPYHGFSFEWRSGRKPLNKREIELVKIKIRKNECKKENRKNLFAIICNETGVLYDSSYHASREIFKGYNEKSKAASISSSLKTGVPFKGLTFSKYKSFIT